jgi:hypothetical protein
MLDGAWVEKADSEEEVRWWHRRIDACSAVQESKGRGGGDNAEERRVRCGHGRGGQLVGG